MKISLAIILLLTSLISYAAESDWIAITTTPYVTFSYDKKNLDKEDDFIDVWARAVFTNEQIVSNEVYNAQYMKLRISCKTHHYALMSTILYLNKQIGSVVSIGETLEFREIEPGSTFSKVMKKVCK